MQRVSRTFTLMLFSAAAMYAAVVQGVVLDDETGYPLARSQVTLLPIAGSGAATVSLRSGDRGAFTILSVRQGWYVLRVTRFGYAPTEAGQMRAGRPGTPFEVIEQDRASFFQIRMKRLGAVTGSVLDENGIGIADWPVHIYTARKPVRRVAETKTDDRGNFRIGALDPASYVVRSAAGSLEDDYSLLPTYHKFGTALENAEAVRVRLAETQTDVTIRPVHGRLFTISGLFSVPPDMGGRLWIVTDTGRRVIASAAYPDVTVPFDASGLAPGTVELYAEGSRCGGYSRVVVERDMQGIRIGCSVLTRSIVDWQIGTTGRAAIRYPIVMRRVDLDGVGPVKELKIDELVMPGHWDIGVQTGESHYVTSVRGAYNAQVTTRDDGWFGVDLSNPARLNIQLSARPASVRGTITTGGKAVTGAVVYLESYNPDLVDARLQLWSTRTDLQGGYSFAGLRPGRYRVLSTFDFDPEDRFAMERGAAFTLEEGSAATQSVELILP